MAVTVYINEPDWQMNFGPVLLGPWVEVFVSVEPFEEECSAFLLPDAFLPLVQRKIFSFRILVP